MHKKNTIYATSYELKMRKGYIDGATTRLCIPAKNRAMRVMQLIVKKG